MQSFTSFSEMMNDFAPLNTIAKKRRSRLLEELYRAARAKAMMEYGGNIRTEVVSLVRADRKGFLKTISLLDQALEAVKRARESYGDLLCECEQNAARWGLQDLDYMEMQKELHFSVEFLNAFVSQDAASIPLKLRTRAEKRLAERYMPAYDDVAEGGVVPNSLATEMQKRLDTWFVYEAANILDKYQSDQAQRKSYPKIIRRLFEAAFGDPSHSEAGVQKMLKRERKPLGLQITPGQPYTLSTHKVFVPDTKFLEMDSKEYEWPAERVNRHLTVFKKGQLRIRKCGRTTHPKSVQTILHTT